MNKTKIALYISLLFTSNLVIANELSLGNIVVRHNQIPVAACIPTENFEDSSSISSFTKLYENGKEVKPTIFLNNNEICFFDLKNSTKYKISFKKGLTDNLNNTLSENKDYSFETKEAKPYLKGERNIILPLSDNKPYINLRSLNIDEVSLSLYKINTNNLDNLYIDSLKYLDSYDVNALKSNNAFLVYEGAINTKGTKDKENSNKIYIKDLLKDKFECGIYIAVFKALDKKFENDDNKIVLNEGLIISNLGVSAYIGQDSIAASVRSFSDAKTIEKVELKLIANNNDVLETVYTDKFGFAKFKNKYQSKNEALKPSYIIARSKDDLYTLSLNNSILNYADTNGLKKENEYFFMYKDRGIYRPNETVYLNTLVRDKDLQGSKIQDSLIYDFLLPNSNVKYKSIEVKSEGFASYPLEFKLPKVGGYGTWTVQVSKDGIHKKASTTFNVADFVPEQIKITENEDNKVFADKENTLSLKSIFNYGEKADSLPYDATFSFSSAKIKDLKFKDYSFGIYNDKNNFIKSFSGKSDKDGLIKLNAFIPKIKEPTNLILKAQVIDTQNQIINFDKKYFINTDQYFLGIKDISDDNHAIFDIVNVNTDGVLNNTDYNYKLFKIRHIYQTQYVNNSWSYNHFEDKVLIEQNNSVFDKDKRENLKFALDDGEYELVVESKDAKSSMRFYKGYSISKNELSLERFDLISDKDSYDIDETINLTFTSPFDGYASVMQATNNVDSILDIKVHRGENKIALKAKENLAPGFYVVINTFKAIDNTQSPTVRSYGLNYIKINSDKLKLNIKSNYDDLDKIKNNEKLSLDFTLDNAKNAKATLSLTDVGILSLTKFKHIDPFTYLTGKSNLGVNTIDNYSYLINRILELKQGYGDESSELSGLSINPSKSVALYKKDIEFVDGKAHVDIDVPSFQGALSLMLTAYNDKQIGSYEKELIVYDNAVSSLALPRFLTKGDKSNARISLHNIESNADTFNITLKCSSNLKCDNAKDYVVKKGERSDIFIPIEALDYGVASIDFSVKALDYNYNESFNLAIREPYSKQYVTDIIEIKPHDKVYAKIVDKFSKDTNAYYSLSALPFVQKENLIKKLIDNKDNYSDLNNYSSYVKSLMLLKDSDIENRSENINDILSLLVTMQRESGNFNSNYTSWFDNQYASVSAVDALLKAQENNYLYNKDSLNLALKNLNTIANNYEDVASKAYALYILSKVQSSKNSDIINVYDNAVNNDVSDILFNIYLARALYNINQKDEAYQVLDKAFNDLIMCKNLYDDLYAREDMTYSEFLQLINRINTYQGSYVSNLVHDSFKLISAFNYCDYTKHNADLFKLIASLDVNFAFMSNTTIESMFEAIDSTKSDFKDIYDKKLDLNNPYIENNSDKNLYATVSLFGHTKQPLKTSDNGIFIKKVFLDKDLNVIAHKDIDVKVNDDIYVLINVRNSKFNNNEVYIEDLLLAGFEYEKLNKNSDFYKKAHKKFNLNSYIKENHSNDKVQFIAEPFNNSMSILYKLRASVAGSYTVPSIRAFVRDKSNLNGIFVTNQNINVK